MFITPRSKISNPQRNNHHSLQTKSNPITSSFSNRKMSMDNLSPISEMDELIGNIKITHLKDQKQYNAITQLYNALNSLKQLISYNKIIQEVQTISLLIQSIQKKLHKTKIIPKRQLKVIKQSNRKSIISEVSYISGLSQVSPIQILTEDTQNKSGIVYTNFSISELQNQAMSQQHKFQGKKPLAPSNISNIVEIKPLAPSNISNIVGIKPLAPSNIVNCNSDRSIKCHKMMGHQQSQGKSELRKQIKTLQQLLQQKMKVKSKSKLQIVSVERQNKKRNKNNSIRMN